MNCPANTSSVISLRTADSVYCKNCPAKTRPATQVGLTDNILSSELRIYKEARDGDAAFKGTVTSTLLFESHITANEPFFKKLISKMVLF
jgi:hypothetical protein